MIMDLTAKGEILLGSQGSVKNGVMYLEDFSEETYNELVFKGVLSEGIKSNARIDDINIIKAFIVKQSVLLRFGVNIEYSWLWKMVKDERYDTLWSNVPVLYEFGYNYEDENMLGLYREISFIEFEEKREIGTLLYDADFMGNITEYEIIGETATMYKVKSVFPNNKFEKKYRYGSTSWYTKRGAIRKAKERIANLEKSISYFSRNLSII